MAQIARTRKPLARKPLASLVRNGPYFVIEKVSKGIFAITKKELTYKFVRFLRGREAKIRGTKIDITHRECFNLILDPDKIYLPQLMVPFGFYQRLRSALEAGGYKVKFEDVTPQVPERARDPRWDRIKDFSLRWRQRECLELIASNVCGRIVCPAGYGKSFLLAALARIYPYARIDISTHSKAVLEMIYEDLCGMIPSVGIVHGGRKVRGERVMCYSGKSLHHADGKADFLFVDECHEFGTEDYFDKVARYEHTRKYGFSANAPGDRADGADFELEGVFGPVLINISYEEAERHHCIVPIRVQWRDVVIDVNPCADMDDDTQKMRYGIWRNEVRNEVIATAAHEYPDAQTLITVDTVEHAAFLKQKLPEFTMVYNGSSMDAKTFEKYVGWGLLDGSEPTMTNDRLYQLKKEFETGRLRKAIATGVWSRGVNFQKLQVLIRADGKNSAISDVQLPGRLARISKDKPYGVLVDFRDQFDGLFEYRAKNRMKRYQNMGWKSSQTLSQIIRTGK